jgi:hypothetical protein
LNAAIIQTTPTTNTPAPTVIPTATSTVVQTATDLPTRTPTAIQPLYRVESDGPAVQQVGTWTVHDTDAASGGRYLYSSGSLDDALGLTFTGAQVGIVFVKHPALGTLAVEIDGILLHTVDTAAETSIFGEQVIVGGLGDTIHTLRVYPRAGVIAVDAFLLDRAPEFIEPTATTTPTGEVIPSLQPTLMPTSLPTDPPPATDSPTETAVLTDTPMNTPVPTETPTSTPTGTPVPSDTPTSTPIPTETPLPTDLPTTIPEEATEPAS